MALFSTPFGLSIMNSVRGRLLEEGHVTGMKHVKTAAYKDLFWH